MDHLIIILIGFVLAISLARIIIPNIIIISRRKGLFDLPDGRKVHRRPISRLGGVCFFPTILFAVTFLVALCKKAGWFFWMDGTTQFPELLLLGFGALVIGVVVLYFDLRSNWEYWKEYFRSTRKVYWVSLGCWALLFLLVYLWVVLG